MCRANFNARHLVSAVPIGFPVFFNAGGTEAEALYI